MSGTGGQRYSPEFRAEMVGLARAGRSPESLGREFERWLGHASLDTTNIYNEIDMEMKAKMLPSPDRIARGGQTRDWLRLAAAGRGSVICRIVRFGPNNLTSLIPARL